MKRGMIGYFGVSSKLEEFKAERVKMTFAQLLYHVLQNHPAEVGVNVAMLQELENE